MSIRQKHSSQQKTTIMTTYEELKKHFDKVHELVATPSFVETVYHVAKANGCTDEEWEENKMPIVARFANEYLWKLAAENN
jgi:hypothetical protein